MEAISREGKWTFDGEILRIVPARERGVHKLRKAMGELVVPVEAIAGVVFEPGRKSGWLRLRLRAGADPFSQVVGNALTDSAADPYRLSIDAGRTDAAEYLVEEIRHSLLLEQVPDGPCDRFLMPGPPVPVSASAGDGTASFDGERVRLEWNWMASSRKEGAGPQLFDLADIAGVEWAPQSGMGYGFLRFRLRAGDSGQTAENDPQCLAWGIQKEGGLTALVAAAVVAHLPHPSAPAVQAAPPAIAAPEPHVREAPAHDHDTLLRRLRELGELHKEGIVNDEEFATAKQALLRGL
ncbi:Short C-terminal domain-containing protein [Actinomadura madurae]|uniref:Short C-terminal domain-containing protein n=1 Tax=Actinomadura madurae TaxID=1993 RepID=A0A1I5XAX5_9ACTN|nr:DUF4429 domain-containing protein [Actinomadura madurae]SFQ29071.1 Short C-terminal domain-containing protein [Actinomadura madurae]